METAYHREEIVSSSKASRNLGEVLNEAKRKGRMLLTALEIQERKARDRGKRISWESLKAH